MSRLDRLRARWPVSPRVHAYAAWAALVLFTLIVISGAAVRLTGSGLGCPEWPRCNGTSVTPSDGHAYIEFGNRLITTPVSIAAVLCLVFALLRRPYRRDFTVLGALLVAGVLIQAVLGGITVMTGLNPVTVMSHFLLSMVTLVVAMVLVWRVVCERAGTSETPVHDALLVRLTRALTVAGGVVVVVGTSVTASGPYAGGEGTDDTVSRLGLFGDDTFRTVMMVHARVAAVFGVAAVALWVFARVRGARDLLVPLTAVCVAVAVTGIIGTLQYHVLDYPAWTVWLHVASVCLTWNMLVWSFLAAGRSSRQVTAVDASPPPPARREPAAVSG
jgi:cytochrome c oxidase assembly protein subunit 15